MPGFWYPYRNIFSLVDELNIQPFTHWTQSSQYSPNGLEVCGWWWDVSESLTICIHTEYFILHQQVESPIFQIQPRLPTPLGTFVYTEVYIAMQTTTYIFSYESWTYFLSIKYYECDMGMIWFTSSKDYLYWIVWQPFHWCMQVWTRLCIVIIIILDDCKCKFWRMGHFFCYSNWLWQ